MISGVIFADFYNTKKSASLFFSVYRISISHMLFSQHRGINAFILMFHRGSKYMLTRGTVYLGIFLPRDNCPNVCMRLNNLCTSILCATRFRSTNNFLVIFIFSHNLNYFLQHFPVQFSHRQASACYARNITYLKCISFAFKHIFLAPSTPMLSLPSPSLLLWRWPSFFFVRSHYMSLARHFIQLLSVPKHTHDT